MDGFLIHASFDVLAWLAAGAAGYWLIRTGRVAFPVPQPLRFTYLAALFLGAGLGAVAFGSANLWLSGQPGIARSIEGAVAGAIVAIEIYKRIAGITLRTGARFALPFAVGVAVGRIGCFFSGLDDFTHGTPTKLPWAHDFGDGVPRHPVQLYESAAMAAFAGVYMWRVLQRRPVLDRLRDSISRSASMALQRFVWEFFKPYGTLVGPFTLFHVLSAAVFAYAIVMIATAPKPQGSPMNAPLRRSRPYIFWGQTQSLCETCLALVPAKIEIVGNEVWYEKRCRQHGVQSTLLSTDAAYWRMCKDYIKPGDKPLAFQNRTEFGCPYDCGLCPDHEQHSCLALIEINEHCNLTCPVCFRDSSPQKRSTFRSRRSSACSTRWSRAKASPTSCRSPAASRRCIRTSSPSSTRRAPADPARDDQHQRHAHRAGAGFRGATRRAQARA